MTNNKGKASKAQAAAPEEYSEKDMRALMAQMAKENPAMLQQLAGGIASMNLAELPEDVRARVEQLQALNKDRETLMTEFNKEVMALRRRYEERIKPLYEQRFTIVSPAGAAPGIPQFWVTAIRNHPNLSQYIEEADLPALAALTDIRCELDTEGTTESFKLFFDFAPNDFFENTQLTKEYKLDDDDELKTATGCEIKWKLGKCLTEKSVKKVVKKRGKGKQTVQKIEKVDSFFHFFAPPQLPASGDEVDDEDEEAMAGLEDDLEEDFSQGCAFKDDIVPEAVRYFTGEAMMDFEGSDDYEYGDEDDEDDDDEDEDEDEDEDKDNAGESSGAKPAQPEKPECKQQ